jgi:hypothetical protein
MLNIFNQPVSEQVLKSRLQSAPTGTYSGFMDCARKTIAQDGVAALWKGFGPAMGRVCIGHSLKCPFPDLPLPGFPRECCNLRKFVVLPLSETIELSFISLGWKRQES